MVRLVTIGALLVAACGAAEDDWVVRPPGGGGGGGGIGQTIDAAAPIDAADGDALAGGLTGLVCVVQDLTDPDACPTGQGQGTVVGQLGTAITATADADGRFTLPIPDALVTLEAGLGVESLDVRTIKPVVNSGLVHMPALPETIWNPTVAETGASVAPGNGSIVLYVETAAGAPAVGAIVALPAGGSVGPFYDTDAGAWTASGGTGAAGVALVLDLVPGTYQLDGALGSASLAVSGIPVEADAVTFVRGRLSP